MFFPYVSHLAPYFFTVRYKWLEINVFPEGLLWRHKRPSLAILKTAFRNAICRILEYGT